MLKQQVDDGKMRVLANWGAERIASFPNLPTFRELGFKDVEFYIWAGLFAQAALPALLLNLQSAKRRKNSPHILLFGTNLHRHHLFEPSADRSVRLIDHARQSNGKGRICERTESS